MCVTNAERAQMSSGISHLPVLTNQQPGTPFQLPHLESPSATFTGSSLPLPTPYLPRQPAGLPCPMPSSPAPDRDTPIRADLPFFFFVL